MDTFPSAPYAQEGVGVILALTAQAARKPYLNTGGFGVAGAAIEEFCRQLAAEVGPQGISVVYTGNYFNPRYMLKLFGKALDQAGLAHIRFHDLHRSVVTLLLAQGVDARSMQELVEHEDIETTLGIYGYVLPSKQQAIADKLGGFFG